MLNSTFRALVLDQQDGQVTPTVRDLPTTDLPEGDVLVSVAYSSLNYRVVASTGRADTHEYLRALGAQEIIDRSTIAKPSGRPLESERWGGAVDSVGGDTLAAILPMMAYRSTVACCGLAAGSQLTT